MIIQKHRELNQGDKFWDKYNPDTCSWYNVQDKLDTAENEYRGKAESSFIRRRFRDDSLARFLVPLAEGIPDSDGLGLIKGALIIIFEVRQVSTATT